ncbi:hypothetical protein L6Q96_16255 [Candidatus Binatia bacterium]|nr:hypothetical protein [Candidatus Binatia bacterium]
MYFVTTKHPGYVLFCLTPSERAAVGITEKKNVQVLVRGADRSEWEVIGEWPASAWSHTSFMAAWHRRTEPDDPHDLLSVLPATIRERARG